MASFRKCRKLNRNDNIIKHHAPQDISDIGSEVHSMWSHSQWKWHSIPLFKKSLKISQLQTFWGNNGKSWPTAADHGDDGYSWGDSTTGEIDAQWMTLKWTESGCPVGLPEAGGGSPALPGGCPRCQAGLQPLQVGQFCLHLTCWSYSIC